MSKKKKHWKKRSLKVLERYIKKQNKKPVTVYQYFFGNTEAMKKFISREKFLKNKNN